MEEPFSISERVQEFNRLLSKKNRYFCDTEHVKKSFEVTEQVTKTFLVTERVKESF